MLEYAPAWQKIQTAEVEAPEQISILQVNLIHFIIR